jgi:hypothetical protein
MTGLQITALLLYFLALARATQLINGDLITDPIRAAAMNRWGAKSTVVYFLECPWCVSIWLAFPGAWLTLELADLPLWLIPWLALAGSHATGLAARLIPNDDAEIETVK